MRNLNRKTNLLTENVVFLIAFWFSLFYSQTLIIANTILPPTVKVKSGIYNLPSYENALILYDKTKTITFQNALELLNQGEFKPYKKDEVPGQFSRGRYHNWIYFRVENIDSISLNLIFRSNIIYDSIFIKRNGKFIYNKVSNNSPAKDGMNILTTGFIHTFFLDIDHGKTIELLIKDYDYSYGIGNNIPKISDTRVFESRYFADNGSIIFLYTSGVFVIATILILFGVQWCFSFDRIYLWYCLYALSSIFVLWRNLEGVQPMLYSTYHYLSWNDSKVFHSVAVFYSYIVFCAVFLEYNPPILKKIVKILSWFCIVVVIIELILIAIDYDVHIRWLLYKFVRVFLTILGFVSIFLIFRSTHPLAKYIIAGGSIMALAEVVSMVLPTNISSTISLIGVYGDFIIFSVALGLRSKLIEKEKLKLQVENFKLHTDKEIAASQLKSRIAKDIHDEIGLGLTSANYLLYNVMNINNDHGVNKDVKRVIEINASMVNQMHDIIWSMDETKDPILEFCADLKTIFKEFHYDHKLQGQFIHTTDDNDIKINGFNRRNILMCMKEGVNNSVKHGKPTKIDVYLTWTKSILMLHIKDNGIGFIENKPTNRTKGNGIKNIQKRVKECNGKVSFYNDGGANILIEIPLIV